MISSYRSGDLVLLNLNNREKKKLKTDHPFSIGSKYISLTKNCKLRAEQERIDAITNVVKECIDENMSLLPKNIEDSTVIHLRLGDVVAGTKWHESIKRPVAVDQLKVLLANTGHPRYIIGKCFFAEKSSTNYHECINSSNEYLQNVLHELEATHFDSGSADIDLCCAVKAKLFVQGRGYFSKLIVEIRKRLGLPSVETIVHV